MNPGSASIHRREPYSSAVAAAAAAELRTATGGVAPVAFVAISSDYLPHIEEFCEILRVDGHVVDIVGATGFGGGGGPDAKEAASGFSLLALNAPEVNVRVFSEEELEAASGPEALWKNAPAAKPDAAIVLANHLVFDIESWLGAWNRAFPGVPCIGGLPVGLADADSFAVFCDGRVVDAVVVGIGGMRVLPVVSQGCRPIGEPLTVTRAESNVVYSLGARPAYEALEAAFEGLSDGEKAGAKGNLFAGLAGTEYVEDFKPGDFLIRNILGADPNSGAVVIGGFPRVGQTLQYQLRDSSSVDSEWRAVLRHAAMECGRAPVASLLFACAGRGPGLFESERHDAALLEEVLGTHPGAGFSCSGEIGPLGDRSHVHSHTASGALFFEKEEAL